MKPTTYLRYVEVEFSGRSPLCMSNHYDTTQYYRLQQWWENEQGKGEWRFVEIDFGGSDERPY